jgi:deoxyuridine 5'-triphosphate nucleotidohydrolase
LSIYIFDDVNLNKESFVFFLMGNLKEAALEYHRGNGRAGKIGTEILTSCEGKEDLTLAYSPGVAAPCLEIAEDSEKIYDYTNKGNTVAVVSNGSAVLGLGNIGAGAGKPVMEGKALLFKHFADVDARDVLVNSQNPDDIVEVVRLISPTYGGINLEDIKAPECFYVEEKLKEILDIPVFHDDQHGTAIVVGAGLLNTLKISGKRIEDVKVVFSGAGAAGIACAKMVVSLGVRRENVVMLDSKGVITIDRDVDSSKREFAVETSMRELKEVLVGADVFIGVSARDILSPEMLLSMADNPVVFAMANPNPEIDYNLAKETRSDVIMATGRSDFPNQVNNVLGFPGIFRGALDARAKCINEEMKVAAALALAGLVDVPTKDYIIPSPFDNRVVVEVAHSVAWAAVKSGVAKAFDLDSYRKKLEMKFLVEEKIGVGGVGVKVKKLKENAVVPSYAHEGDAAMDLCSAEDYVVPAGKRQLVSTGIAMELPEGYWANIRGKSGLAYKKGISTLGGVIEHTYRGEYGVVLLNTGDEDFVIKAGDKIAQVVIAPVATADLEVVEDLSDTVRGKRGFGSGGGNVGMPNEKVLSYVASAEVADEGEVELERTFLAKYIPEGLGNFEEMEDCYFPKDAAHPILRLRRRGDKLLMTKKTLKEEGNFSEFIEETIRLSAEEYGVFDLVDGKGHCKKRYSYDYAEGVVCEVDVYGGDLKGLVVVDFEFDSVERKDNFVAPDFCLVEVTEEEFIAGGVLCGKKYEDIKERLNEFGYEKL